MTTKIHKLTAVIANAEGDSLDIGSFRTLKMIDEHAAKMRQAVVLLNSMVLGGEEHSDLSKRVVADALALM